MTTDKIGGEGRKGKEIRPDKPLDASDSPNGHAERPVLPRHGGTGTRRTDEPQTFESMHNAMRRLLADLAARHLGRKP